MTLRQRLALSRYRRGQVTQAQLAAEWGIRQPAVSRRLARARVAARLDRYAQVLGRPLTVRTLRIGFTKH